MRRLGERLFNSNIMSGLFAPNTGILSVIERLVFLCFMIRYSRLFLRKGVRGTYKQIIGSLFSSVRKLPGAGALIDSAMQQQLVGIEKDLLGNGDSDAHISLPATGMTRDEIFAEALRHSPTSDRKWGGVYHKSAGPLVDLQNAMWGRFNNTNTLYPTVFPAVRKFEAEIVSMVRSMLHGDSGCVGLLSSGGTESILLAVLAYREQGRARGIERPEIICGLSAHPALKKACHYFSVSLKVLPLTAGMQLDPVLVSSRISPSTVAIYANAPSFSHGVVDDIEALGRVAMEHQIGLHVDNCLGGVLLSFLEKAGLFNRRWDFSVPGVTTISTDVHKYGQASKGVSVVCFRDAALRKLTYVPSVDGCEGL